MSERSAPIDIYTAVSNARLCAQGHHAWVPWLDLGNGSRATWCVRQGCDHREQWDAPGSDREEPTP